MTRVSFVDKVVKAGATPIHLIRCKDLEGNDCYFFVMAPSSKLQLLREAVKAGGALDLTQYGHIVASGFGKDPSAEVKQKLKEEYGYNPDA